MAAMVFQLSASNVSGEVVTLPVNYQRVTHVEMLNTGNYPNASAVAPATFSVILSGTPAAGQVLFTAASSSGPSTLTFPSGTTLDTTYGSIAVEGTTYGQVQLAA